jgi:hypothetical protein
LFAKLNSGGYMMKRKLFADVGVAAALTAVLLVTPATVNAAPAVHTPAGCETYVQNGITYASIEDPSLLDAFDDAIGQQDGTPVPLEKSQKVTQITWRGSQGVRPIDSLAGIQCAPLLWSLSARNGYIKDISPLTGLTALTDVVLSSNNISNLTPLANKRALQLLDVNQNNITYLPQTGLTQLAQLTQLDLSNNHISNLALLNDPAQLNDVGAKDQTTVPLGQVNVGEAANTFTFPASNIQAAFKMPDGTPVTVTYPIPQNGQVTWVGIGLTKEKPDVKLPYSVKATFLIHGNPVDYSATSYIPLHLQ